jgi:hypothetical protein
MGKVKMLKPRIATLSPERVAPAPSLGRGGVVSWRAGRTTVERGYNYRWKTARNLFLAAHPLCECADCDGGRKRITAATVVDHHVPHRGDPELFWNQSNWRAMAKACHDRKTQRELQEEANGKA